MAGMRGRTKRFTLTLVYLQLQSFQCSNAVSPDQCAPGTWSGSGSRCPWGWGERSYAGCLYYNSNDKRSWSGARDGCVALGGYLATADSYSEYAAIDQYRLDTDGLSGDGWDTWGGIYRSHCGTWYNMHGKVQSYFKWDSGEPSSCSNGENCMQFRDSFAWNDENCGDSHGFVCQRAWSCAPCSAGTYSPGTFSCTPCAAGKFSSGGASTCTTCTQNACSPGSYRETCPVGSTRDAVCVPCSSPSLLDGALQPSGVFRFKTSGNPCEWEAAPGYFGLDNIVRACSPGTYTGTWGLSACVLCAAGSFQAGKNATICTSCLEGTFQDLAGQSYCKECSAGKYTAQQGLTEGNDCTLCAPGTYENQTGSSACKTCFNGFYSTEAGQSRCLECPPGSYNEQPASTSCNMCSELLEGHPPCLECYPDGKIDLTHGQCLTQGVCFTALTSLTVGYEPSVHDRYFQNGTAQSGCQFCTSASPASLAFVRSNFPCPSKKCGIQENHEFVCLDGTCSLGRKCTDIKPCFECRDEVQGCELMKHHCELSDGSCGCLIEGECYHPQASSPCNRCQKASDVSASASRRCTGSWVPIHDPIGILISQCAGGDACRKNQRCEHGVCLSEPYDIAPDSCAASYTCTGNGNGYAYVLLTPEMLPRQCHEPSASSICELPGYCTTTSTKCDFGVVLPEFNHSASHVLNIVSAYGPGGQLYTPLPIALDMINFPAPLCKDQNGNLLEDCDSSLRVSNQYNHQSHHQQRIAASRTDLHMVRKFEAKRQRSLNVETSLDPVNISAHPGYSEHPNLAFSCGNDGGQRCESEQSSTWVVVAETISKIRIEGYSGTWDQNADIREFEFHGSEMGNWGQGNRNSGGNRIAVSTNLVVAMYPQTPGSQSDWIQAWVDGASCGGCTNSPYIYQTGTITTSHFIEFEFAGTNDKPRMMSLGSLKLKWFWDRQDMSSDDNFGLWNVKLLSNMGHWYDLGRITLAESALISESSSFYYFDFLLSAVSSSASILASSFRAVDGNRNTDWGGGSCTHTNTESNPWWKLDFGQARSVRSVTVWNRGDCCQDRLDNFDIRIGNTSSAFDANPLCATGVRAPVSPPYSQVVPCHGVGRYLFIVLPGSNRILTMCEVVIGGIAACSPGTYSDTWGLSACELCAPGQYANQAGMTACKSCSTGTYSATPGASSCVDCPTGTLSDGISACPGYFRRPNLAFSCGNDDVQRCETEQSSTAISASSFRAVDGNRNTDWGGGSCTHTNTESNPWWKLDFGQARSVRSVTVWNRGDCCQDRLDNFDIRIGNTSSAFDANPLCATGVRAPVSPPYSQVVPCHGVGRYLFIVLPGSNRILTLCEVVIDGNIEVCSPGTYSDTWGLSACELCAPGKYANQAGMTACKSCSTGTYSDTWGLSVCELCAPGKYANQAGMTACKSCSTGTYSATPGLTTCVMCPSGKFKQHPGAGVCHGCGEGRTSRVASSHPADCTCLPGHMPSTSMLECASCIRKIRGYVGRFVYRLLLQRDAPMEDQSLGRTGGSPVDFVLARDEHIVGLVYRPCTNGGSYFACSISLTTSVGRDIIVRGTEYNDPSECGADIPWRAPDGHMITHIMIKEMSGKVMNVSATTVQRLSACTPCAAGSFNAAVSSSEACTACPAGTYSDAASASQSCVQCPENSYSMARSSALGDCKCMAGFTGPDGGECTRCENGTIKLLAGAHACIPAGDFLPGYERGDCCPGYDLLPAINITTLFMHSCAEACECTMGCSGFSWSSALDSNSGQCLLKGISGCTPSSTGVSLYRSAGAQMRPDILLCSRDKSDRASTSSIPICGAPSFTFLLRKVLPTGCPTSEQEIKAHGIFLGSQRSVSLSFLSNLGEIQDGDQIQGVVLVTLAHPKKFDDDVFSKVVCSDIVIVDSSPPYSGKIAIEGSVQSAGVNYLALESPGVIKIWFNALYDPHSHVASLQISGVMSTGRVLFFETLGRAALMEGFANVLLKSDEKDGSRAVVTVTAFNGAGLNTSSLITFIFDNQLPVFVGKTILDCCTVHPCHDGDMNFTSNDGLLKGCWMKHHFVQNISGISHFESRLEKWHPVHAQWDVLNPGPCSIAPNQTSAEFGINSQDPCRSSVGRLQSGYTYRISIRAISGSGLPREYESGWIHSDGIRVDVSPPLKGRLLHVDPDHPSARAGIHVQASSSSMHVTWEPYWDQFGSRVAFEDPHSNALHFSWAIGEIINASFNDSVLHRQPLGVMSASGESLGTGSKVDNWQAHASSLDLQHNHVYYAMLFVSNDAGLEVLCMSPGVRVDMTEPNVSAAYVEDVTSGNWNQDADYANLDSITSLIVSVGGISDRESGDHFTYEYAFGTLRDPEAILSFTSPQDGIPIFNVRLNSTLQAGILYLSTVKVCNQASLCGWVRSDGITFDASGPQIGTVLDGHNGIDINYQANASVICGSWPNVSDPESDVMQHEVAFSECDSGQSLRFVDVGLDQKYCFQNISLKFKSSYCITLRSTNRAGIHSIRSSDGVMICGAPLTESAVVVNENVFSGTGSLQVWWSGFRHNGAPIVSFSITILKNSGERLFDPVHVGSWWNFTFDHLNISEDGWYHTEVCAFDVLRQSACVRSDAFAVDQTPPTPGLVVNGPFLNSHIHVQSATDAVRATWAVFRDKESGIRGCRWCLGSLSGKCDLMSFQSVGPVTWAQQSDLELHHLQILFITVTCVNGAGSAASASSSPILVHTEAPTFSRPACISLLRTACDSSARHVYASKFQTLQLSWDIVEQHGIQTTKFWSIGLTKGGQEVRNFTNADQNSVQLPALGQGRYFISVLIEDELHRTSYSESSILTIDESPPDSSLVEVNPKPGSCPSPQGDLRIRWQGFSDVESGISHFLLYVGNSPDDDSIVSAAKFDNYVGDTVVFISSTGEMFITIVCENNAGLQSRVSTQVIIDRSPPRAGLVLDVDPDVRGLVMDTDLQAHDQLKAVWDPFHDPECPIAYYDVALVEYHVDPKTMDAMAWTRARTQLSMILPVKLAPGIKYKILVRGNTTAGLSTVAASDGVTYVPLSVESQPSRASQHFAAGFVAIQPNDPSLAFNGWLNSSCAILITWNGFEGALRRFEIGLGGAPGDDSVLRFQSLPADAGNIEFEGPFPGGTLYASVVAYDDFGESVMATASVKIDTSPPISSSSRVAEVITSENSPLLLTTVSDDFDCILRSNREISVVWDPFEDNESGIQGYEAALILKEADKCSAMDAIVPVNLSTTWFPAGVMTSLKIISLSLLPMREYCTVVRGWNRAQLHTYAFSDGFLVVSTNEIQGEAFDGDDAAMDVDFMTGTEVLSGGATFKRHENAPGILRSVHCAFGTTRHGMQIQHFKPAEVTVLKKGGEFLETVHCRSYRLGDLGQALQGIVTYVSVRATTCWGGSKIFVSDGALVDNTPPSFQAASVRILGAINTRQQNYLNRTQSFIIAWDGIVDFESSVTEYEVSIFSQPGRKDFAKSTNTLQSMEVNASLFTSGTYSVRVRAKNQAGLVSERDLTSFTIDDSPPISLSSFIAHRPDPGEVEGCQSSTSTIRFSWQECMDDESPIVEYSYAIIEESEPKLPTLAWSSAGLATFVAASNLRLVHNQSYHVSIRCENAAGLFTFMRSPTIVLTNVAPNILSFDHSSVFVSSDRLTARGTASIDYGFIQGGECGFGLSPLLARANGKQSKWKAILTKYSATHYGVSCEIHGVSFLHGRTYFMSLEVFSCSGVRHSRISGPALVDKRPPIIENFTLAHQNQTQLPTSWRAVSEKQTLYVRSSSLIFVISDIIDFDSGLAPNVTVKISGNNLPSKLVYGGVVRHHISVDLSRFSLSHATTYSITIDTADSAGNLASSHAFIRVDDNAPTTGRVLDGSNEIQVRCHGSNPVIFVGWSPFVDLDSEVLFYQVAVATKPDVLEHDLVAFGSTIEFLQAYFELNGTSSSLLRTGDTAYVTVKATNAAGLSSSAVSGALTVRCATQECRCSQDIVCM